MKRTIRRNVLMGLAGWLALSVAFGGTSTAAAPPPPRFVTIPDDTHVLAIWDNSNARGQGEPAVAQPLAGSDTALISKSADGASVVADGTLQYSIAVTNATNVTQRFRVTDTLPVSMSYITNTATGGLVYNAVSTSLTATTHFLNAFHGDVVTTTGAPPYIELLGKLNVQNLCPDRPVIPDCDDVAIPIGLPEPFRYFGVEYSTITLDSNGFVIPGSVDPGPAAQNQTLPDTTSPNNVIAPFWDDLDLNGNSSTDTGGGDLLYAVLHDSGSNADYLVVEWHDAQQSGNPGTAYSFQVWIQLNAEHITFAYDTPAFIGDTTSATVGFENSDGTLGHSYLHNGTGQVPADGAELQLSAVYSATVLGFQARAKHGLRGCAPIINTASVSNGAGTHQGTAAVAVNVFGPFEFLPVINR